MAFRGVKDHFTIEHDMKEAISLLDSLTNPQKALRDAATPQRVLTHARGLAFLLTYKV